MNLMQLVGLSNHLASVPHHPLWMVGNSFFRVSCSLLRAAEPKKNSYQIATHLTITE